MQVLLGGFDFFLFYSSWLAVNIYYSVL